MAENPWHMTQSDKTSSFHQTVDRLEEEVLVLEMENHDLKQKIKNYEFDQYKLQEIQKLAKAGSWELNHLSYDLEVSEQLSQLLDLKSLNIERVSWHDFLDMLSASDDRDIKKQILKNVIEDGENFIFEHSLVKPDGRAIFIRHHCKTFYNSIGQPLTTVGLIVDINTEHSQSIKLEQLSITDELTTLYNRRHINEVVKEQYSILQRYQKASSCIMIDIDFFKHINDSFGHQAGDEVLRKVAQTIKNNIRTTDFGGRWGGEEFLIVCQNTLLENTTILAEKLRKAFMDIQIPNLSTITASFGVGQMIDGEGVESIIKRIDDALYQAKENGRNQVKIAELIL